MNKYIVSLQPNPSREELEWAWKFTVFSNANGRCQHCNKQVRLDACHIKSRQQYPELEFEPTNGIALCRHCHLGFDHYLNNRPSGRQLGYNHSQETRLKMSTINKLSHNTPEYLANASDRAIKQWDMKGRKAHLQSCKHCGKTLTKKQQRANNKFCSPSCHYQEQTGRQRGVKL